MRYATKHGSEPLMDPIEAWARANVGMAEWLSSIGTVGALAAAVYAADRAARQERRRAIAILHANITMLKATLEVLAWVREDFASTVGETLQIGAIDALHTGALQKTRETLQATTLSEVTDPDGVEGLLLARATTDSALRLLLNAAQGDTSSALNELDDHIFRLRKSIVLFEGAWRRQLSIIGLIRWALDPAVKR